MTYLVISDGLHYKVALSIETYKNHTLVELVDNKQQKKVKTDHIIYLLEQLNIDDLTKITQLTNQIDSNLLSELIDANEVKIPINKLASLYFGDNVNLIQTTALLIRLAFDNTIFHNYQDGTFRRCTVEEQLLREQINQKQQQATEQFNHYSNLFTNAFNSTTNNINSLPLEVDVFRLLYKPDKHSPVYKALHHIAGNSKLTPLEFCYRTNLIQDLPNFFTQCFIHDNFPNVINPSLTINTVNNDSLPQRLDLNVFSIDDANTTEIDDAFSIETTENGHIIGIHIAAPALNSEIAPIVATNISTVYFPGNKITMLPENVIEQYSLWEQKTAPVVSIYFAIDSEFNILEYHSKVNVVKIAANLRIEELETLFNSENLGADHGYQYENELKLLYKFALKLEEKRGKPSVNTLTLDYNFSFDAGKIQIKPRVRGNPIDKLVSELMILANCSWGRLLTNAFIPAIYRVKQPNYPVRMTLSPDSHSGLNVDYYTWSTSPLRRSTDYINQKQIISLINQDKTFYTAMDHTLSSVVETFDAKYAKYLDFQNKMERYWSLQYLIQEQISETNATFVYKTSVQLEGTPLEIDLANMTLPKPKGSKVRIKIYNINLANLTFDFKVLENITPLA